MSHSIDHLRHLLSSQKLNLYYVRCRVSVCMLALHPPANELQATQTSSMHAHKNTLRISTSAGKYPTNLTLLFFPTRWPKCVCVWVSMNIFVRVKCARVRIIFPQWFNVVCLFFLNELLQFFGYNTVRICRSRIRPSDTQKDHTNNNI